ncbi:MAG TPA: polymer-forming cytoskeletal protein [Roseiflexaceae bacterium]|jgi:cytoskeletal protein CcmA (bactofilin family)|nr:polymer-forming cytoskeletal protein [Roseiflexaceae bacterium]
MFYRRNHEQPATPQPQAQSEQTLQLDVLDDFDDITEESSAAPVNTFSQPPAEEPPTAIMAAPQVDAAPPADLPEPIPFVAAQPSASDLAPRPRPAESVIGPDDFFDGNYRSERGVRIQGNARGSIESRQYIYVEEGAQVEATLAAEDITIAGSFNGTIECRGRLEVAGSGVVQGRVQTARLVVHDGGVVDGELHMQREEQAINAG